MVRRRGTREGKDFDKLSDDLSSLAVDAVEFGSGIRGHRLIENGLHWVKDVVFGEDGDRFAADNAATNWSTIRSFDLNLLRRRGDRAISHTLRLLRHDLDALFPLLTTN
ncbi:MAG: transposase [Leptolyngbyaceae cyanobacterium SM1_3_5]|nr:transposase [Leptolyngbyaceae cyanobacterium SM1_3_5]